MVIVELLKHEPVYRFRTPRKKALEARVAREGVVLTDSQVAALEKTKEEKKAHGEIKTHHPGYLGAQDTYYLGTVKGVGRIYQQTFIDTYAKVAFNKLYDRKNALVTADLLNDRVISFYEQHDIRLLRILTDRGTEYCGQGNTISFSCTWPSSASTIPKPRRKAPRPTVSVNVSTEPSRTSYAIAFRKKI